MKKIILIISCIIICSNLKSQVDTLNWLKNNIEQKKSMFIGKQFKIVLDSLKQYKKGIKEYSGARDASLGLYMSDTIWVEYIELYFETYFFSAKKSYHDSVFFANHGSDTTNTHIKRLRIYFVNPLPFLSDWWETDRNGIGGETWNKQVEYFYRKGIVKDIKVDEY